MVVPPRWLLRCTVAGLLVLCCGFLLLWLPPEIIPVHPAGPTCPSDFFATINAGGRLGNQLCQYASLWALQLDDARARPAWILPEMQLALAPLFSGLALPALSEACVRYYTPHFWKVSPHFWEVSYFKFGEAGEGPPHRPLLLTQNPCDLERFDRHRGSLLPQLTFRPEVRDEAQRRLRLHTDPLCRGPPDCTFIGVHVRRTDYGKAVKRMYDGMLVGEAYLNRALELCRRRYRRPVFVVCSDDLAWVRQRLHSQDLVVAGSSGVGSAGRDMALLAQCNHTVVTHGTYGYMSAFLAQGNVVAPTGFGRRDAWLSEAMRERGFNITAVPAF